MLDDLPPLSVSPNPIPQIINSEPINLKPVKVGYFTGLLTGKNKFPIFITGLVLGIIVAIKPTYTLFKYGIPFLNNLQTNILNLVDEVVPSDLEVTIKNNIATSNVREPYFVEMNRDTFEKYLNFKNINSKTSTSISKIRLITINTSGKIEDFEKFQSIAMLTGRNLVYYSDGDTKINSLGDLPDMVINRSSVKDKINTINEKGRITKLIKIMLYVSPLAIIIFYPVYFMIELLGFAFYSWLITKILSVHIKFVSLIHLAAAIYTFPALVLIIVKLIPILSPFYYWIYIAMDALCLALSYVVIHNYAKHSS